MSLNKKEAVQSQIDGIMDTFDFRRVRKMMLAVGWTWANSPNGTPEEWELRARARELLNECAVRGLVSTGGFTARYVDGEDEEGPWLRLTLQWGVSSLEDGVGYEAEA